MVKYLNQETLINELNDYYHSATNGDRLIFSRMYKKGLLFKPFYILPISMEQIFCNRSMFSLVRIILPIAKTQQFFLFPQR